MHHYPQIYLSCLPSSQYALTRQRLSGSYGIINDIKCRATGEWGTKSLVPKSVWRTSEARITNAFQEFCFVALSAVLYDSHYRCRQGRAKHTVSWCLDAVCHFFLTSYSYFRKPSMAVNFLSKSAKENIFLSLVVPMLINQSGMPSFLFPPTIYFCCPPPLFLGFLLIPTVAEELKYT